MSKKDFQYICECVKDSLFLGTDCIYCGCSNTLGIEFQKFNGGNLDFERIEKIRKAVIAKFINGELPERCVNCYMLKKVTGEDACIENEKFLTEETHSLSRLYIAHWLHCNCGCIYCCNGHLTKLKMTSEPKKSEFYDVFPIVRELCEKGYVQDNTFVTFLGGEVTVLDEFEKTVELLLKHTKQNFQFLSSGIKFSKIIEKTLSEGKCDLCISIDSWNRELYKKIKRTDSFDAVVENSQKYAQACKDISPKAMVLKYILIKGLNDTQKDIDEFVSLAKNIGIQRVILDVNHKNFGGTDFVIPNHYYDLFDNFKKITDIEAITTSQCDEILKRKTIF